MNRTRYIEAHDLDVTIGKTQILHNLSFSLGESTRVGIVGPNGSGKTTLMRALGGLLPYHGTLMLEGRQIRDWKSRNLARKLAFMRQRLVLEFDFNVYDFVSLGRTPHKRLFDGLDRDDRRIVAEALEGVEMETFRHRVVNTLSGGEQQRIHLAQAMVQQADVLLLDEPTAHLDVHYQFELMERISSLAKNGKTVVAVYHDLTLAARYADCLLVLDRGGLAAEGVPEQVLTPELIREVFRMESTITHSPRGHLTIEYHAPVSVRASPPMQRNGLNRPE